MDAAHDISIRGRIPQLDLKRRLRLAREEAGLEQIELAHKIGIAVRSVINYEKGYTQPKKPVLMTWAIETDVPLAWLADGINTEADDPGCSCQVHAGPNQESLLRNRCCQETPSVSHLSEHRRRRATDRIEELPTLV